MHRYDAQETSCNSRILTKSKNVHSSLFWYWEMQMILSRFKKMAEKEWKQSVIKGFLGPAHFFKLACSEKHYFQSFITQSTAKCACFVLCRRDTILATNILTAR